MRPATIVLWLLLTPALTAAQDTGTELVELSEDLTVTPLAAGVWRHVSTHELEDFGRVAGNGLVVVSGAEAAVIDTPWTDEETRDLFRWVEERFSARVTAVVPTHSHGDCAGGLAAAHRLGAHSYASKKTARFLRRDGGPVPRNTFRRRLELEVGDRRLVLHAAGPGHTADNIVVWIPDEKILFGGCLVRSATSRSLGYTAEADLRRWPRTIETLLELYGDALWIVPGHGPPGGTGLLENTLRLLEGSLPAAQ